MGYLQLLVVLAVVSPPISARNIDLEEGEEVLRIQPRFLSWFTGKTEAASDDDSSESLTDKVGNVAKKAGSKIVSGAVTSALGANGVENLSNLKDGLESGDKKKVAGAVANTALSAVGLGSAGSAISNVNQAVKSGDKKKVVGAVADAALTVALGPSGVALAKTGVGAAGQGLKAVGNVFGGALSKIGGDSVIGQLGNTIQDGSSKVGGQMTEYAGGENATKTSAGQLVGQVTGVALNVGLGPVGGAMAKTGINAAGKLLQAGGGLVGNKLSEMGGDSAIGKLGNVIQGGSKVVGGTMTQVGAAAA